MRRVIPGPDAPVPMSPHANLDLLRGSKDGSVGPFSQVERAMCDVLPLSPLGDRVQDRLCPARARGHSGGLTQGCLFVVRRGV